MGFIRPATPGFIVTLGATVLLALVSFGVPILKTIYFLKANFSAGGYSGSITFGTLGYCLELSNGTTCSTASVGYQLDINALVGNNLPFEIPEVIVKWITYALVLHIVALGLAGGSAIFGLLAHVREMSMTCCSTFVSGFAAFVALVAFIFDLVLFFVSKSRINNVQGGHAEMGIAIWLTLASWLLLFFSGCFYTLGRCCIRKRPRGYNGKDDVNNNNPPYNNNYGEQMHLDAVKAEADRKARQKQLEGGLPAFHETQPLTGRIEGSAVYFDDPSTPTTSHNTTSLAGRSQHSGYVQGEPGTRAVDEYYNPTSPTVAAVNYPPQRSQTNAYPPQHQTTHAQSNLAARQPSLHTIASSGYGGISSPSASPPPAMPNALSAQYLQPNTSQDQHGHTAGGTSYHSAASHQQYPSSYSQYDAPHHHDPYGYNNQNTYEYSNTAYAGLSNTNPYQSGYSQPPAPYYTRTSPPPATPQPQRQYTLGGAGYGESTVPVLVESPTHMNIPSLPYPGDAPTTSYTAMPSGPRGPRMHDTQTLSSDAPPMYEAPPAGFTPRREKN